MIFFIERGEKTGGYIVMVHCFSQSVFCFIIIKPRNKKRRGKNDEKEKGIKRKGQTMEEKIGRKEKKRKKKRKMVNSTKQ